MPTFDKLAEFILEPLEGQGAEAWHAAPPGKWSPGEIVDHLTTAMENSARGFASRADKPPMIRRPRTMVQRVGWVLIQDLGWFPPGRQAPESTRPASRPERTATETRLRNSVGSFLDLERTLAHRTRDLFLKHPVLGDLTWGEFMRFHVRHAEHHRKQIVDRLRVSAR